MTDAPAQRRPAWLDTLVFAAAAGGLLIAAARVMFSTYMFYDDEGYVLMSLRNFAEHGGLYRDVYSQYGPFPFVLYYVLHLLGLPLTHSGGRLFTLVAWGTTVVLCAALARHVTRSLLAGLIVLAAMFAYLWVMASEPSHPGGLIVLLTAVVAVLGHHWLERDRLRAWALLAGLVAGALLLTKINVGVFVAFAAGAWFLLHHRDGAVRRWAPAVLVAASVLLPLALMRPLLGAGWVQTFALVWALAALAVLRAAAVGAEGRTGWSALGWGVAGAAIAGAGILAVVIGRGTSPADIWEGIVLAPMRHATAYSSRYRWAPGAPLLAVASLGLCLLAGVLRHRRRPAVDTAVALARLVAAVALAVTIARIPDIYADHVAFGFVLPALWLFAWPLAGGAPGAAQARAWLVLVLLGQCLHPFPVAGSQIAWGTLLAFPAAALGAWEAATWLTGRHADRLTTARRRTATLLARLPVALLVVVIGWRFVASGNRYPDGENSGLPGGELLRLPARATALYRVLTLNAVAHADLLFSEPGMFSFNLWSGVPTPTRANVTHWFSLLDAGRQEAIRRQLAAHPRACVIIDRAHIEFLERRGYPPAGPLHDYLAREFAPAFRIDNFEFCVHRGRRITPFLVGELLLRTPAAGPAPVTDGTLLRLSLLVPPAAPIAWLELTARPGAPREVRRLDATNTRVELIPLNARGDPAAAAQPATWPLTLRGPSTLAIYFASDSRGPPTGQGTLILRDAAGREIGLARLQN